MKKSIRVFSYLFIFCLALNVLYTPAANASLCPPGYTEAPPDPSLGDGTLCDVFVDTGFNPEITAIEAALLAFESACAAFGGNIIEEPELFIFTDPPGAEAVGYFVCFIPAAVEPEPVPVAVNGGYSDFRNIRVVEACNSSCKQKVLQERFCNNPAPSNGGRDCSGPATRIVETSCSPGTGMCPINAGTTGKITDNSNIQPGTAEFSTGQAIENLCPQLAFVNNPSNAGSLTPAQNDLFRRCGEVIREGGDERQVFAVENMSAEEVTSQAVNLRRLNGIQLGNIAARLSALRPAILQASESLSYNSQDVHPSPGILAKHPRLRNRGGAAGDDEDELGGSKFGLFISGIRGDGEKDETSISSGFDNDSTGYTVGVDYLLNPTTVIGVALGYGTVDTEFSRDGGSLDTDTTTLSIYGSKFIDNGWFLDGVIGVGDSDYVNKRNINYTASGQSVTQTAVGKTSSDQLFLSLGVGKTISKAVDIDFTARASRLTADVDRFSETIAGQDTGFGLALEIDKQKIKSLTSNLGIRISKVFSTNFGVVIPQFNLSWLREFDDNPDNLRVRFVNDPFSIDFSQSGLDLGNGSTIPTIFEIPLDDTDSSYGIGGVGINFLLPRGITFYFNANSLIGLQNIDNVYYSLGLRKDF